MTVKNTGSIALTPSYCHASGDFSETDNCQGDDRGSRAQAAPFR